MTMQKLGMENGLSHPTTIDLHCHLRGTLEPSHALLLAEKHGIALPILSEREHYSFSTFDDFLALYDRVSHVIRSAEDLRDVAFRYLNSVATSGTLYVEFMVSPGHSIANGIPFLSQLSAISEAIEQAESEFGISSSIIVTCVRHRGPDEALEIAELAASVQCRHLRGFGLTGNERVFDAEDFKGAFLIAENSGLGLTAHTGEWLPAETVLHTVNALNLTRVGHGISAVQSPEIMSELADRKVGFEICMSSNVALGASNGCDIHPARSLIDAGCTVALCTDDPAYFRTTPDQELELALENLQLTEDERWAIVENSINMAFCDEAEKLKLNQAADQLR